MSQAYVYIMTNRRYGVLYTGVTGNLVRRVAEHKLGVVEGFTDTYNCHMLVYYLAGDSIYGAIATEKQMKKWCRQWKINVINEMNPGWDDLSPQIGVTDRVVQAVARAYGISQAGDREGA
jgi:putative endonuclease